MGAAKPPSTRANYTVIHLPLNKHSSIPVTKIKYNARLSLSDYDNRTISYVYQFFYNNASLQSENVRSCLFIITDLT